MPTHSLSTPSLLFASSCTSVADELIGGTCCVSLFRDNVCVERVDTAGLWLDCMYIHPDHTQDTVVQVLREILSDRERSRRLYSLNVASQILKTLVLVIADTSVLAMALCLG